MNKTIFITSFNPFISRNILSTDVLNILSKRDDLKIVILVPDYKKEYFRDKFEKDNVFIEGCKMLNITKQDVIFRYLTSSIVSSSRLKIRHQELLDKKKSFLKYFISRLISKLSFNWAKKLIRVFDYWTINKNNFRRLFIKYNPDLVFSTDIFHNDDIHFLAEAKFKNVKTISMVRSWDNITNKGLFRVEPDDIIVHNEVLKNQVVKYEAIRKDKVFISGLPQFDDYVNKKRTPRKEFFKKIDLDPDKKTILFTPHGERFHKTDWQILNILQEELPDKIQFIVRFPPNDTVGFGPPIGGFKPDNRFHVEKPGVTFTEGRYNDREVEIEDTQTLADDIYHSDLLINYGSTVTIDAVAFDKPSIIVAFDGWEKLPYIKSVRRFLDYDHIKLLIKTKSSKVAHNKEELIDQINLYLKDPSVDAEGRNRLKKEQIWKLDGKSGKRIADFIYVY